MPQLAVIIPAAGRSARFGANKLMQPLAGEPVLSHATDAFRIRDDVTCVFVAIDGSIGGEKVIHCAGGACRAESVLNCLRAVPKDIEWVAIHDAARPLVSQGLINRTLAAALEHGAAAPALAVTLTVKQASGPLPAKVQRTIPRATLWTMQTPQIMRRATLLEAFERCPIPLDQVTDDAQLLELVGHDVWLVPGDEQNIKITTPMDLKLAELWLHPSK